MKLKSLNTNEITLVSEAGYEQSTVNLEMVPVQGGGSPLRKGVVNHPVCSSKCVRAAMRQLGTRLAIERASSGNSAAKVRLRNMELGRGCEVKRETLNLVVSPVMFEIWVGQSSGGRRRQQKQGR